MLIILTILSLLFGILVLWFVTFASLESRRLDLYYPLMLLSVSLMMLSAIFFYQLLLTVWHLVFGLLYATSIAWILITYIRLIVVESDDSTDNIKSVN